MGVEPREDWAVIPFKPVEASPEEWAMFHAYRRVRHAERDPDEPLRTDPVTEANMKMESKTWFSHRFYVEADGLMVAHLEVEAPKPGTPEYPSNKHLVYGSFGVIEPYRRRGVGTQLLRHALDELDALGARVLTTWTSEDDGQAFAEHVGMGAKQVERISRLDFEAIDWDMMDRWIRDLETRAPGTTLEFYEDRIPEDFLEEYCPALTKLMNLMPWDDADHGDIVITPDDRREMQERLDLARKDLHTFITREPDGTISGITDMSWGPDHPGELEQWFTGVDPDYRGRGLGKALKASMLRYCAGRYAGLKWVRTGNSTTNGAMLAINDRLGFKEYRRYTVYQIERDGLAEYLEAPATAASVS